MVDLISLFLYLQTWNFKWDFAVNSFSPSAVGKWICESPSLSRQTYPEHQRCWPAGWASCVSGRHRNQRWWRWCSSPRAPSAAGRHTPPCLRTESRSKSRLRWCWTWQGGGSTINRPLITEQTNQLLTQLDPLNMNLKGQVLFYDRFSLWAPLRRISGHNQAYLRCVVEPPCAMAIRMPPWSPQV